MAIVSRLELDHPALGTAGGSSLHTSIEAIYTKIGNNMADRFFYVQNLNAAASADCDHNFNTDFGNLRIDVYGWNEGTGELTFLTESTTPKLSEISIIAKVGDTLKQITVTNNSALQVDLGVVVMHDPIELNELTDVNTAGKEDGQALVYDVASTSWKPGASGDASFKIQSITDPNAVIKGGYIMLPDGRELATYDGAGSASTDFGKDITVNLDTIFGGNPVAATTYYLYIDLDTLGSEVTCTDNGRRLYAITESNFKIFTTVPASMNLQRYIPRAFIRSATAATTWDGTGSAFGTLAFLRHDPLGSMFSYVEQKKQIITSATTTNITHGLTGTPQQVHIEFYDASTGKTTPLPPASHVTDITSTTVSVDTTSLTFATSDEVRVYCYYTPTVANGFVATANRFESPWYTSTATTTVAHGLTDMDAIKSYCMLEWNTTTGRRKVLELSSIVTGYDNTNVYLDWTGFSPSATLQYKIISGGTPLPGAIPTWEKYSSLAQTIGSVGASGQIKQGHILTTKSFKSSHLNTSKLSFFNLASDSNDEYGGARNLTQGGTPAFTGTNIFGTSSSTINMDGTDDTLFSSDAFFNPGDNSFSLGAWFAPSAWGGATRVLWAQAQGVATKTSYAAQLQADNKIHILMSTNGTSWEVDDTVDVSLLSAGSWHHVAFVYDSTANKGALLIDGKRVYEKTLTAGLYTSSDPKFGLGTYNPAGGYFLGKIQDFFFIKDTVTDHDIAKIASTRIDHNANVLTAKQEWRIKHYPLGVDPATPLDGVILDMSDSNSLFVDFSGFDATDKVDIRLFNFY